MDQKVLIARARELTKGGHMCQGDSGSPLFVRKNNRFVQIGMNKHVFQFNTDSSRSDGFYIQN